MAISKKEINRDATTKITSAIQRPRNWIRDRTSSADRRSITGVAMRSHRKGIVGLYPWRLLGSIVCLAGSLHGIGSEAKTTVKPDPRLELELSTFVQYADVNGDGIVDKCVITGSPGKHSLSCTLGVKPPGTANKGLSPQKFVSQSGIDFGYAPRVLVDVNGDGRADFCRYVMKTLKTPHGRKPSTLKVLRCMLTKASGFATDQYTDPNTWIKPPLTLSLYQGSDGTPIKFFTNLATGSWYGIGTDLKGNSWRLEGDSEKTGDTINAGTRLRGAVPLKTLTDGYTGIEGLLINQSVVWAPDNSLDLRIGGGDGPWMNQWNTYWIEKGFEFIRSGMDSQLGYSTVKLHVWNCTGKPPNSDPSCEQYFSGKQYKNDAGTTKISWDGQPPLPLSNYLPEQQISVELGYFQSVLTALNNAANASIYTGVPWFDSQPWYAHTSQDWVAMQQDALSQNADRNIDTANMLKDLGVILAGGLTTVIIAGGGGVLFGAFAGMFIATEFVVGTWVNVGIMKDNDFLWCKAADFVPDGCRDYITFTISPSNR